MHAAIRHLLLLVCLISLMGGCAVSTSSYYPVRDRIPRQSTLGFSICPPPGASWFERHQDESLFYLKRTRPSTYSIYTKATEIRVDKKFELPQQFHDYVRKTKELRKLPTRYRNAEFHYADVDGLSPYCVRYQNSYEDHPQAGARDADYYLVKKSGILCMHPDSPQYGIDMFYLERSAASSTTRSFAREGEQFLSSLQFHQLKR